MIRLLDEMEEKMTTEKQAERKDIVFEIIRHLGVITKYASGWSKEVNLVSWNGGVPKYDIRDWDEEHEHMSRGITLHGEEARKLLNALVKFNNRNVIEEAKAEQAEKKAKYASESRPYVKQTAIELTPDMAKTPIASQTASPEPATDPIMDSEDVTYMGENVKVDRVTGEIIEDSAEEEKNIKQETEPF